MLIERTPEDFYHVPNYGLVPKGWDVLKLGQCFDLFPTATFSRDVLLYSGDLRYIHYGDIHTKFNFFLDVEQATLPFVPKEICTRFVRVKEGDLILADASEDYEGVGKTVEICKVFGKELISGLHTLHLREKGDCYINGIKTYIFNNENVRLQILRLATGIKVYSISKSDLKKILLPVPSIEEQRALQHLLSELSSTIDGFQRMIDHAFNIRESLITNFLTGRLRPSGKWRGDRDFFDHEKFGKTPSKWTWGKLSDIATIVAGQSPSGEFYNDEGDGVPMLNGPTEFTNTHPVPVQYTTKATKICEIGDILFTVRGSSTGRMNIADQKYCIGRGIAAIRNKNNSNPDFLYYTLQSIAEKILAEAKGSGTTFPNVNKGELGKRPVLIPPKEVQQEISDKIKQLDTFLQLKRSQRANFVRIRKGVIQKVLSGKFKLTADVMKFKHEIAL
jgi:type I restriction enzyme, S subunit